MDFAKQLSKYTPKQIVAACGCSQRTAYAWKTGEHPPPAYRQSLILLQLKTQKTEKMALATSAH